MSESQILTRQTLTRFVAVAGSVLLLGFLLYRQSIFIPTHRVFQFAMSGVSIGIAYAGLKRHDIRNGLAALFVWYLCVTALLEKTNSWMLILNAIYIAGMSAAVVLHQWAVESRLRPYLILRIALAGAIASIANGLIIIALFLFSWRAVLAHPESAYEAFYVNLQIGALIGLGAGIGMEIAEYLIAKYFPAGEGPIERETSSGHVAP